MGRKVSVEEKLTAIKSMAVSASDLAAISHCLNANEDKVAFAKSKLPYLIILLSTIDM